MSYMLDTNICIFLLKDRSKPKAAILDKFREHSGDVFISVITLAELEHGVAKSIYKEKNTFALIQFLSTVAVLNFDSRAAVEYGELTAYLERNGCIIGQMDRLIAAHARAENMTVVTNNVREFKRVPGIQVEDWSF